MPKAEEPKGCWERWSALTPKQRRRYVTSGMVATGAIVWCVLATTILADTYKALKYDPKNPSMKDGSFDARMARANAGGDVNETAVIGAIIGFVLGPIMLVWGYQVVPLVIVCNAFISSGVSSFVESVAYMDTFNADVSNGRLLPSQIAALFKITLSAFTLSTVALKVEFFSAAMKAGVVALMMVETVTNQIPPQFGCACVDGSVACSPLYRQEDYARENACYQDWWLRFGVTYTMVLLAVVVGVRNPVATNKINIAIVGANLCCQAIFDTVLAVLPSHGSRVQPYRMVMLGSLSITSYKLHDWLRQMDAKAGHELVETEILPLCFPVVFALQKVGLVVMLPLNTLSQFFAQLRTFGQDNLIAELMEEGQKKGGGGVAALLAASQASSAVEKLEAQQAAARGVDDCARTFVRGFNLAFVPFGVALVALGGMAMQSEWKDFLSPTALGCVVGAGVVLIVVGCLGYCGAQTRSRGLLLPYMAIVAVAMLLQLTAAGVAYGLSSDMQAALDGTLGAGAFNASSGTFARYTDDALDALRAETEGVFTKSQCAFAAPHAPVRLACGRNAWFQTFANTQCESFNGTDVAYLSGRVTAAIAAKKWSTANLQYARLKSVSSIATGIEECQGKYAVGGVAPAFDSAGGLFCTCRSALVQKLNGYVLPAATIAIVLALMELIVLVNCATIYRNAKKIGQNAAKLKMAERAKRDSAAGAPGNPAVDPVTTKPTSSITKDKRASGAKVMI